MKELKISVPEGYEIDKENSAFEYIKLKKIEKHLPKTWKEFCDKYCIKEGEHYVAAGSEIISRREGALRSGFYDKHVWPSKEYAEASLALCQLVQLRDCYNDGWKPDWTFNTTKYVIEYVDNILRAFVSINEQYILTFKTKELRDEFFNNFRDLIEIAKPLL